MKKIKPFSNKNDARIDRIMQKIGFAWAKQDNKDQRFFQFLYNETRLGSTDKAGYVYDPFHITDEDFEKDLDRILKRK